MNKECYPFHKNLSDICLQNYAEVRYIYFLTDSRAKAEILQFTHYLFVFPLTIVFL